ncbi:vancomycin resistance protein [Clostridium sp. AM58-1XD]|nr:vancomycin resistance protein [Clostridium sp. AM58-1XD]
MYEGKTEQVRPCRKRSRLRAECGKIYYGCLRRAVWLVMNRKFASCSQNVCENKLPYVCFEHRTPLLRRLKDLDMQYQYNKITNLRLASARIHGVVIHPGQIFSYWKLIGKPTYRRGYLDGMVLKGGRIGYGPGGGLCQMSNLIFWMVLHSPLTVTERHRHSYDVFPDSNRKQPFGSGATCSYLHIDLMIRNDTDRDFQIMVWLDGDDLRGELRSSEPADVTYEIVERNHMMKGEYWGGYSRHNELYRQIFKDGTMIGEEFVLSNHAMMMYAPFISDGNMHESAE